MNKIRSSQERGGGIVAQDGRWVMLCGPRAIPIRLLDAHDREIPVPEAARDVEKREKEELGIRN